MEDNESSSGNQMKNAHGVIIGIGKYKDSDTQDLHDTLEPQAEEK